MSEKIIINPMTRISGFMEIEAYVENNIIVDAICSGMLFRGFEKILIGRAPFDAIYLTERICGICSAAHSVASATANEDALNILPNLNGGIIRQIIHGCEYLQNHIRHFYQYTLPDYVDGPKLNPVYTESHVDYRLPKKINERLSEHYVEATKFSRAAHRAVAILGGKAPHNHGVFVGGSTVNLDSSKMVELKGTLYEIKEFVRNVMLEDVYTIAAYYRDYFDNGRGPGNFMSYGAFDKYIDEPYIYVKPNTYIDNEFYPFSSNFITENIYNSWYSDDKEWLKPEDGYVEADRSKETGYSFVKAPRYGGLPMEVGPLARMWLSKKYTNGISTMDRTIARVLETIEICHILHDHLLEVVQLEPSDQGIYTVPESGRGTGLIDTTRGALGHWLWIENQSINRYTIITPSAWNCSPTDSKGVRGPIEQALIGTYIEDIKNPVAIGRIVRSFDPCISCATHVISDKYKPITIKVV